MNARIERASFQIPLIDFVNLVQKVVKNVMLMGVLFAKMNNLQWAGDVLCLPPVKQLKFDNK